MIPPPLKKPVNYESKMEEMKKKFMNNTHYFLEMNKKCDQLTTRKLFNILNWDDNFYGLPNFTYKYNNILYTHSCQFMKSLFINSHKTILIKKKP